MVRRSVPFVLILGLAASARAEEPSSPPAASATTPEAKAPAPVPPSAIDEAAQNARFKAFVIEGDRARAAGKLTEAATAYSSALEVQRDPIIAGRLGVLMVDLGLPADAGDLLLEAIERGNKASPEERLRFYKAYDKARAEVTWLDITISHAGTKLTLDGQTKNRDGFSALSMFVPPGEHELRARLVGYEDAIETFTARKGEQLSITLTLKELPKPIEPPVHLGRERPEIKPVTVIVEPPDDEPEREPIVGGVIGQQKAPGRRFSLGAGPVIVFGVATWSPAVGPRFSGSLRLNDLLSLGLDAQVAWLPSGINGYQIDAMTAGGIASACGHIKWLFGCGLGYVGGVNVTFSRKSYTGQSEWIVLPGGGGRLGVEFHPAPSFAVRAGIDVIGLGSRLKVAVEKTVVADQPPVFISAQVTGEWEF